MIMYNQVFDLYHTVFRFLQFLNRFDTGSVVEVERLRIWDFYFLFPNKVHEIRLKRSESDIRMIRNRYIRKTNNPYDEISENRKVFEKIRPYHLAALNCIASYGIIDKEMLSLNRVVISDKEILNKYIEELGELSVKEKNIVTLLTSHFFLMSLFGADGLKSRTNLLESRYDTE